MTFTIIPTIITQWALCVSDRCYIIVRKQSKDLRVHSHFSHLRTNKVQHLQHLPEGGWVLLLSQEGKLMHSKSKFLLGASMTLDLNFLPGSEGLRQVMCQESFHPSLGEFLGRWGFLLGDGYFTLRIKISELPCS